MKIESAVLRAMLPAAPASVMAALSPAPLNDVARMLKLDELPASLVAATILPTITKAI